MNSGTRSGTRFFAFCIRFPFSKSAPLASPYKYVCDWFKAQFPDYKEIPTFETNNIVIPLVSEPNTDNYKQKEQKEAA